MSLYRRTLALTVDIVQSVPDVGTVVDHLPIFRQEKELLDLLKVRINGVDQIRGWLVTSAPSNPLTRRVITPTRDEETLAFQLHGYRAITKDQSSEIEFRVLCETLGDALSEKVRAGETSGVSDLAGYVAIALPAQIKVFKPGLIGGTWCHYALMEYALKLHVTTIRT